MMMITVMICVVVRVYSGRTLEKYQNRRRTRHIQRYAETEVVTCTL